MYIKWGVPHNELHRWIGMDWKNWKQKKEDDFVHEGKYTPLQEKNHRGIGLKETGIQKLHRMETAASVSTCASHG
mgnify:FL=1